MAASSTKLVARVAAIRILQRLRRDHTFISVELRREFNRYSETDPRDRALTTELVYGILRQQRRLDFVLAPRVKQDLYKLEDAARLLLRLGAYQILFLDRIPKPICVSATQDAARDLGLDRLTGLLNAVLRKIDPERSRLPRGSSAEAIGVRASLPNWIVQELRQAYGIESYEAEAMSLRERAQTTIRPNSARGSVAELQSALAAEGFHTEEGPRGMLILTGPGDPFNTQAFHAGGFVPQDPASLAVVDAMGDVAGKSILDLCSGRGIKATELAARGARVTCVDNASSKLEESARLAERLGVRGQLTYLTGDPTRERLKLPHFDHVLVDAPCSGLGTLRRHPEIAWRRKRSDLQRMATLQAALLSAGADFLKEKGELTYAVCSFARIEGAVAVPSGLAPLGDDLILRPTDGWDAFQLKRWQRKT